MFDTTTIIGVLSIGIGFFLFMGSFLSYYYKKSPRLTWGLFIVAILFLTVIPVFLAVFFASTPGVS